VYKYTFKGRLWPKQLKHPYIYLFNETKLVAQKIRQLKNTKPRYILLKPEKRYNNLPYSPSYIHIDKQEAIAKASIQRNYQYDNIWISEGVKKWMNEDYVSDAGVTSCAEIPKAGDVHIYVNEVNETQIREILMNVIL